MSRKPPRTPGSAQGTALARGKEPMGLFRNRVPGSAVTRDEEQQSPFPQQHPQPRGLLEHSVQGTGHRDSVGKCRWRKKEVKERRRALGNMGGLGTEAWRAPSRSGGGPDMPWGPCSRASVRWPPACALPSAAGCGGSRSQRFPPLGHSKIDSRKKRLSVFPSTLQARKSHPARPPPTQTPPPLRCRQRGLYNLKKSPCAARGGFVQARQERELSGRKLETRWHASAPCSPGSSQARN